MSSARRLPNESTSIGWAEKWLPKYYEVTPDGAVALSMNYASPAVSYRGVKAEWRGVSRRPYLLAETYADRARLLFNKFGDSSVVSYRVYGGTAAAPDSLWDTTAAPYLDLTDLERGVRYHFAVTAIDEEDAESPRSDEVSFVAAFAEPGDNLLLNGDFADSLDFWTPTLGPDSAATFTVVDSVLVMELSSPTNRGDVTLAQTDASLEQGKRYRFEFVAWDSAGRYAASRVVRVDHAGWTNLSSVGIYELTEEPTKHSTAFTMTEPSLTEAEVRLELGGPAGTAYVREAALVEVEPTDVADRAEAPRRFELRANYPNPFNPVTTISFALPKRGRTRVEIFNALGERVETLHDAPLDAGEHRFVWNAADFPSGAYFCRVTSGANSGTLKLLLLK
jgi:hypothetical protein